MKPRLGRAALLVLVTIGMLHTPVMSAQGVMPSQSPAAMRSEAPEVLEGPMPAMRRMPGAVFFAGDSLTYDTWHWAGLRFEAQLRGWKVSGARARGGLRAGELADMWPGFARNLPGRVLVAIGANDVIFGTSPTDFKRAISRIIRLSPGRIVVLVGIYVRSDPLVASREEALNSVLRELGEAKGRVRYADWGSLVHAHPTWPLPSDVFRIHLTPEGLRARAQFYLDSLGRAPRP